MNGRMKSVDKPLKKKKSVRRLRCLQQKQRASKNTIKKRENKQIRYINRKETVA